MGDHPEAVRDGFRDGLPVPWQGFAEEPEDRFGELAEVRVEPVARSVRRETRPDAVLRPLQKELQRLRVRVAGTIQEDIDCPACRGGRAPAPSAASGSSRCRRPVWTRSRACPRERTGRTSGDASRISRPYLRMKASRGDLECQEWLACANEGLASVQPANIRKEETARFAQGAIRYRRIPDQVPPDCRSSVPDFANHRLGLGRRHKWVIGSPKMWGEMCGLPGKLDPTFCSVS